MGRVKGQKIEKREERNRKIISTIANMEVGETITPTAFSKNISIHPDTFRDLLDFWDSIKGIGIETLRDKEGKIKLIIRNNENLDEKMELREIQKRLIDFKTDLDKIKLKIGVK